MRLEHRGGRRLIAAPEGSELAPATKPRPDGTLVKALARAWRWQRMLDEGVYATVSELGDAENISKSYVSRICGSRCWRRTLLSPFRGAGGSGTTAGEFGATAATELEGTSRAFRLVNRRGESMPSADFILCLSAMPS
jgi:hypothetical protein